MFEIIKISKYEIRFISSYEPKHPLCLVSSADERLNHNTDTTNTPLHYSTLNSAISQPLNLPSPTDNIMSVTPKEFLRKRTGSSGRQELPSSSSSTNPEYKLANPFTPDMTTPRVITNAELGAMGARVQLGLKGGSFKEVVVGSERNVVGVGSKTTIGNSSNNSKTTVIVPEGSNDNSIPRGPRRNTILLSGRRAGQLKTYEGVSPRQTNPDSYPRNLSPPTLSKDSRNQFEFSDEFSEGLSK